MKRYLISGALTLIAGLLVTSCHDKMENEYISNPVTVKTEEFDKAFKEAFTSNIDPTHDWGFGSTTKRSANTRAEDSQEEEDAVRNDPDNQSDITQESLDFQNEYTRTEYFQKRHLLQYGRVFCEDLGANYASNRKDFDYNDVVFDAYLYRNDWWKKTTRVKVYEVRTFKKLPDQERQVVDENNDPVFEAQVDEATGQPKKDENGNIIYDVPVMETYNALEYDHSETRVELDGDPVWERVTNQDEINNLDSEGRGRRYYADILLMACGATKPIKVGAKSDGSPVTEVHEAFGGYSVDCVINAFDQHTVDAGGFGYHELAEPVRLDEMEIPLKYITVDDPTIKDIPIFIQGGATEARKLEAEKGAVPQKYMSTNQDNWTSERCFLGDAYPHFTDWAVNKGITYSEGPKANFLYSGYPGATQNVLPFGVATTGAESIECKAIDSDKTTTEKTPNTDLIIRVTEDGDWPEGWEVYDKDEESPQIGPITPPSGGGTSAKTTIWTGNKNYQGWSGPDTFSFTNAPTFKKDDVLVIYVKKNDSLPYQDHFDIEVNHINWGGQLYKGSMLKTDSYLSITLSESDAELLNINNGIWIASQSCDITEIAVRQ